MVTNAYVMDSGHGRNRSHRVGALAGFALVLIACITVARIDAAGAQVAGDSAGEFDPFVEEDFPFITTTVDAGSLGTAYPRTNLTVRGVALNLGHGAHAVFDPDLLRMAAGWQGAFVSMTTMAQVSYHSPGNKQNDIPRVLGAPVFATGMYPGWSAGSASFEDPRASGPNPDDPGRGPIPSRLGQWQGLYLNGDAVILSYRVGDAQIRERPGAVEVNGSVGITRTFRVEPTARALSLVVGEVRGAGSIERREDRLFVVHGPDSGRGGASSSVEASQEDLTVTAFGASGLPEGARLAVREGRYVIVRLPGGPGRPAPGTFRTTIWTGPSGERHRFDRMVRRPIEPIDSSSRDRADPARWPATVETEGRRAPDTSAFVADSIGLPLPNPWDRNVRPADVAFFEDGRAAVVTFSGDVWICRGLDGSLENVRWRRFASGLYEPLSVSVVDGAIYTYGREGIVRLRDLDGDGEAEFYENFSSFPIQSTESREFPLDMAVGPDARFYVSMGGALDAGPQTSASIMPGFRAGSAHSGSILAIDSTGRQGRVFATGFREPYLGVHPETGMVTASDQEGHFVPSTPVYPVREGRYYGVPATAHRSDSLPEPVPPISWIPHFVDDSGASQRWVLDDRMGPLTDHLVHFSYGRPGLFRVYMDRGAEPLQGAVVPIPADYGIPTSKGAINPADGQIYAAGFQIYGSRAERLKGLRRIRYTGRPTTLPEEIRVGAQGIVLRFADRLERPVAESASSYAVARWNYRRTNQYGSGHFMLDGTPGEEGLPVAGAYLSDDGRSVLVVVPDVREVMQMELEYRVRTESGAALSNTAYLTVNQVRDLDLSRFGLDGVPWRSALRAMEGFEPVARVSSDTTEPTARKGRHLYDELGCAGCHSLDGTTAGRTGPSFQGLYGSNRPLTDGGSVRADSSYMRESILQPGVRIVEGYQPGMPAYRGVLSERDVRSLILFIRSLSR